MIPLDPGRQGTGHRRVSRANPESALLEVALVPRLGGEPAPEYLVQPLGPLGGDLQPIRQGGAQHLLPQHLIKSGEAGAELAQQAALPIPLSLESLVAGQAGLPLRLQLPVAGPGERQLGRQGIQRGLQTLTFPAEGAGLFIRQLESRQPGLGLQLLQAIHLGAGLVEPALCLAELLLPLLLALAGQLQPLAGREANGLLIGE